MKNVLKNGGIAILSYSHHIPGVELKDDAFFEIALAQGFEVHRKIAVQGKHMWKTDQHVDIFIVELRFHNTTKR